MSEFAGAADQSVMIEARGLSKFYGDFAAVRDVSFGVRAGEVVAFLGPNGAGKSTTMKLLTGYLAPSAGTARLAGHDMAMDRLAAAARLGYLPENGPLYGDMTPRGLLEFMAKARGLDAGVRTRRIARVIEQCALEAVVGKAINKLSRGYRQRVGMANVLLHEPDVLILDEPTAGLDPNQIREVRETIRDLGRDKTVLLSTHILQEVEALADRVLVIHEGQLVFDGPPAAFREHGDTMDACFAALTGGDAPPRLPFQLDHAMRTNVTLAIFFRNFVSYFSSPIGYVFICEFVLLSAIAAFWPNQFFNDNIADLGQLNQRLPWILIVFIPAITMSIWADERRQGTDELLLTLPATDVEVVFGKYLAGLAIYTVALLFSLSNLVVLVGLGDPDVGLVFANYAGYWLTGMAMLAIGVVASFLTSNLTVAFILAVAFNAPLVFASTADTIIPGRGLARVVEQLGLAAQFQDFADGVISLSSVAFFVAITVVMLYIAMVLIGRRHWVVRSAAVPMSAHYGVRAIALALVAIGVVALAARFDTRLDVTSERLSTVSPQTKTLLASLDGDRPVFIDAYISPEVPEAYVATRRNLVNKLREVDALGGDRVVVRINDTERFSPAASEAEEQFGIVPRPVPATEGGRLAIEDIHLGVAFMSGLDKVVVPFFDRGLPVEYELVRSIATVSRQERPRLGVLATDAQLFGGFEMQTMSRRPDQQIITELRKQYEVVRVSAASPITETYDALLAVQPSSLPPDQLENFLAAVRGGQPTAVFEDPFPFLDGAVPATSQPRRAAGGSSPFQQQQPPPPKGDINQLWDLLGVTFQDRAIVWDAYNPYPKIEEFFPEFVFVSPSASDEVATVNPDSAISRGLQQVMMLFTGVLEPRDGPLTFTPLLRTGTETGLVPYDELIQRSIFGQALNPARRHVPTRQSYVLAARVQGEVDAEAAPSDGEEGERAPSRPIDVVLVADLDLLQSAFFNLRAAGREIEGPVAFDFDNVSFVLNTVDALAGDDRFIAIRSRRPKYRSLTAVERRTEVARAAANDERQRFENDFETQRAAEEAKLNEELQALQARTDIDARELALEVAMMTQAGQKRLQAQIDQMEQERDRELTRIERDLALEIRGVQNRYKLAAVALPPVPPLLVALVVWVRRRSMERIGVPKARLRTTPAMGGAA